MLFLRPCSCETASQNWGRNTWWLKAGISSPAEYHSHDPGQAGLDISSWRKFEHIYEMITACYSIYIRTMFSSSQENSFHVSSLCPELNLIFCVVWLVQKKRRTIPAFSEYSTLQCLVTQSCSTLSCVRLLCPWTFSRQGYWCGLPCLPPGDLPNPETEPRSPALLVDSLSSEPPEKPEYSTLKVA